MAQQSGPTDAHRTIAYERVFGEPRFEAELFPAIKEEAEARGVDATDPGAFRMLGATATLLRELSPEPNSAAPAPSDAVLRYGVVAYHAYHYWRAGRCFWLVTRDAVRSFVETPPRVGEWSFAAPATAGYLALPHQLFWVPGDAEAPPEPVDGLSWVHATPDAPVRLLLPLGVRPDRPGFTMVDIEAPLPEPPGRHWADGSARDGEDFANVLPGGELANLHALTTPAEALKLLSLCLWAIDRRPDAVRQERTPSGTVVHLLDAWDARR